MLLTEDCSTENCTSGDKMTALEGIVRCHERVSEDVRRD